MGSESQSPTEGRNASEVRPGPSLGEGAFQAHWAHGSARLSWVLGQRACGKMEFEQSTLRGLGRKGHTREDPVGSFRLSILTSELSRARARLGKQHLMGALQLAPKRTSILRRQIVCGASGHLNHVFKEPRPLSFHNMRWVAESLLTQPDTRNLADLGASRALSLNGGIWAEAFPAALGARPGGPRRPLSPTSRIR